MMLAPLPWVVGCARADPERRRVRENYIHKHQAEAEVRCVRGTSTVAHIRSESSELPLD